MEKIIYSKYSNDRRREFAIRTDICCDDKGNKAVYKTAMFPEGKQHLNHMYNYYAESKKSSTCSEMGLAECSWETDGRLKFEYLNGTPLDEILDRLLAEGESKKVEEILLEYIETIYKNSCDCEFNISEPFKTVFGDVELPGKLQCGRYTNIDMILPNVLIEGTEKKLIDYEWVFDFPIPAHYVAFRILYYYIYSNSKRKALSGWNLYEKAGISSEEAEVYLKMENHFQEYILNGRAKYNQLYTMITPGIEAVVDKQRGIQEDCFLKPDRLLHVFFSKDTIFSEEESAYYRFSQDGTIKVRIPVTRELKNVRIDPGEYPCVLNIESLRFNGKIIDADRIDGNWTLRAKQKFFFDAPDPQMVVCLESSGELELQFQIMDVSQGGAKFLGKQLKFRDKKIDVLRKQLEETKRQLHAIENTKTWKMHEKCSRILTKKGKINE
ncbi:hypothetical protein [Frisingicoccus sp.]|uniref:hypothetical protein n=1 Tax=Frisingicoccus sp. TaxID=1918627 RepID=UPI003AB59712